MAATTGAELCDTRRALVGQFAPPPRASSGRRRPPTTSCCADPAEHMRRERARGPTAAQHLEPAARQTARNTTWLANTPAFPARQKNTQRVRWCMNCVGPRGGTVAWHNSAPAADYCAALPARAPSQGAGKWAHIVLQQIYLLLGRGLGATVCCVQPEWGTTPGGGGGGGGDSSLCSARRFRVDSGDDTIAYYCACCGHGRLVRARCQPAWRPARSRDRPRYGSMCT